MYDRSSYVLFVRDAMQKRKSSDFNSNKNHLRECAQSWSMLSTQEKQHYKDLFDREWQQYLTDVQEFKKVCDNMCIWRVVLVNQVPNCNCY